MIRIMCEEHGFQRSGKKCREKFENLYKYYKKTKEGKAGRQDGKHYRFFRQLEALCGDTAAQPVSVSVPDQTYTPVVADDKEGFIPTFYNANTSNPNSLSLSAEAEADLNSSEFETSSSDEYSMSEKERKRRGSSSSGKSYWKTKIKGFIDQQMRKLVDRQEAWLEKLTNTLEKKEEERRLREEEWRQQEMARTERERRFWARERTWIEARDTALVEALQNLTGKVVLPARASFPDQEEEDEEAAARNNDNGDEIAAATDCDAKESGKKRKGNSRSTSSHCNYGQDHQIERMHASEGVSAAPANDSCFPFLMADGDQNFWENYGLKMNKGDQN